MERRRNAVLSGKFLQDNPAILLESERGKHRSRKGSFTLIKIRFFVNLYDFLHRDTEMYIPDILCI
jgi:hypothetical protein